MGKIDSARPRNHGELVLYCSLRFFVLFTACDLQSRYLNFKLRHYQNIRRVCERDATGRSENCPFGMSALLCRICNYYRVTGSTEGVGSSVGLVSRNAPVLIDPRPRPAYEVRPLPTFPVPILPADHWDCILVATVRELSAGVRHGDSKYVIATKAGPQCSRDPCGICGADRRITPSARKQLR